MIRLFDPKAAVQIIVLVFLFTFITSSSILSSPMIKDPNVSGQFYESDPKRLSLFIDELLKDVSVVPYQKHVGVTIVPHAGHIYSGSVAAHGFKAASKNKYKTIVLLGPTHYYRFDGVSVWAEGGFKTPLGLIEVDEDFAKKLLDSKAKAFFEPKIFERDHVLEVELPFLQRAFQDFKIVPIIMDRSNSLENLEALAEALDQIVGEREDVLLVVSSDLSHFHDDKTARSIDQRGIKAVEAMDINALWEGHHQGHMEIDGFKEVITALLYAKKRGLNKVDVLKYANSGDVTGDRESVVGYVSIVIYRE